MTISDADRQRLIRILGMLGSEHAGERADCRAAGRGVPPQAQPDLDGIAGQRSAGGAQMADVFTAIRCAAD